MFQGKIPRRAGGGNGGAFQSSLPDFVATSRALLIAARTRCGVIGVSLTSTPSGAPTAPRAIVHSDGDRRRWGTAPRSPMPLMPYSGVRRRGVEMPDLDRRHFRGPRQQVIGQGAREWLTGLVIRDLFVKRGRSPARAIR